MYDALWRRHVEGDEKIRGFRECVVECCNELRDTTVMVVL
jgi:hypothetical protein